MVNNFVASGPKYIRLHLLLVELAEVICHPVEKQSIIWFKFSRLWAPNFKRKGKPEISYPHSLTSDHVAKFGGNRPRDLQD